MGTVTRPPVPLGSGFAMGYSPSVRVDDPTVDVVVELDLDVEEGRLVVTELRAERRPDGPPVTVDVLKSLPLVSLVTRSAEAGLMSGLVKVRSTGPGSTRIVPARPEDLEKLPDVERAAVVYRAAFLFGLPPTAAVAEALGVSRDVAAKRVQAARQAGLLEPTTKGRKAGKGPR